MSLYFDLSKQIASLHALKTFPEVMKDDTHEKKNPTHEESQVRKPKPERPRPYPSDP